MRLIEELDRIAVLRGIGPAVIYLLQIGHELRLPKRPMRHVIAWLNDISPSLEIRGRARTRTLRGLRSFGIVRALLPMGQHRCSAALSIPRFGCLYRRGLDGRKQLVSDLLHRPLLVRRVDPPQDVGYVIQVGSDILLL